MSQGRGRLAGMDDLTSRRLAKIRTAKRRKLEDELSSLYVQLPSADDLMELHEVSIGTLIPEEAEEALRFYDLAMFRLKSLGVRLDVILEFSAKVLETLDSSMAFDDVAELVSIVEGKARDVAQVCGMAICMLLSYQTGQVALLRYTGEFLKLLTGAPSAS